MWMEIIKYCRNWAYVLANLKKELKNLREKKWYKGKSWKFEVKEVNKIRCYRKGSEWEISRYICQITMGQNQDRTRVMRDSEKSREDNFVIPPLCARSLLFNSQDMLWIFFRFVIALMGCNSEFDVVGRVPKVLGGLWYFTYMKLCTQLYNFLMFITVNILHNFESHLTKPIK